MVPGAAKRGSPHRSHRILKLLVILAVLAGVWFLILVFVDVPVHRYLFGVKIRGWIHDVFRFFNMYGKVGVQHVILIWVCLIAGTKSEKWRMVFQFILALLVTLLPVWAGKIFVPRYRPEVFKGGQWFETFLSGMSSVHQDKFHSFPSGDAATAFAISVILAHHFPHYRTVFYVLACGCAAARVVLSAHFPSDVFAGAVIGILVGRFVLLLTGDVRTSS